MRAGKILYFLILVMLPLADLNAQAMTKKEIRKTKTKAENLFDKGEYYKSLKLWEKLLSADSVNAYYNYHAGVCKFNLKRYRKSSLKHFLYSYNKISHDVHYYLGCVYHLTGKFAQATQEFNLYLTSNGQKTIEASEVKRQLDKVKEAEKRMKEPTRAELFNLGPNINSSYPDYVPLISADGKVLFFTSRRPGSTGNEVNTYGEYYEDIYQSRSTGGKWDVASNIGAPVNSGTHDACVSLTPEGQTLLIYRTSKTQTAGDIYASVFDGANWTEPVLLSQINTEKYLEPSACYSSDGNTIYFSSNMPGGYGGKDLYRITKLPNGHWSLPSNLGPLVNTPFEEDAPFIHPDDKRLYFSSTGHENMGGYDVYYSSVDSAGKWSRATNLGYPLNTVDDDIYFVVTGDGSTGFISSDREGGSGETDIYQVVLHEDDIEYQVRSGYVKEADGSPVDAKITLIDNKTNTVAGIFKSNHFTGKFIMLMVPGREYTVVVEGGNHHSETLHIHYSDEDFQITLKRK